MEKLLVMNNKCLFHVVGVRMTYNSVFPSMFNDIGI